MDFLRRLLGGEQSSHQPPQIRPIEQRPASMRDGMQVQLYEAKRTWRSWARPAIKTTSGGWSAAGAQSMTGSESMCMPSWRPSPTTCTTPTPSPCGCKD